MSNHNDGSEHRPTKAERKEQARLEREQIQRRVAARKGRRSIILIAVAIIAVIAIVGLVVVPKLSEPDPVSASGAPETPAALLAAAKAAAKTAGCDDVTDVGYYGGVSGPSDSPDYLDQSHIGSSQGLSQMPPLSAYPSTPPASGPHDARPLPAGVYDDPPNLAQAIHSLEHGATIVWYEPSAPAADIAQIRAFYDQSPADVAAGQDRVIVAPFAYPELNAAALPGGDQMALVSWHNIQTCATPSLAVALDFTSQYSTPPQGSPPILDRTYLGVAPEPGGQL